MKKQLNLWIALLLFTAVLGGCSTAKEAENDVQDELGDFKEWVNNATANVANRTEEDWKQAKQDFKTRTEELDQKQNNFTADVKDQYQNLKDQFNEADEEYQRSHMEAVSAEWQRRLLGRYADLASINESNVQEAYVTFMENVRAMKGSWSDEDWGMAKMVLNTLDERRKNITGDVPTDAEVKIKALQMEFHTLETAADVTN